MELQENGISKRRAIGDFEQQYPKNMLIGLQ